MTILFSSLLLFLSTNIDDVLLLTLWFSSCKTFSERKNVFIGQFIGFSIILIFSAIGSHTATYFAPPVIGLLGFIPIAIGVKELLNLKKVKEKINTTPIDPVEDKYPSYSDIFRISLLTFANGGDNIGIYIPSFTLLDTQELILLIAIFYLMLFVLCLFTLSMVNFPLFSRFIERYIARTTPYILILIGVFVLFENKTILLFL